MFPMLILSLSLAADPTPKIPIGKDTTFVDGPIDKEGYIQYDVALNAMMSKGITSKTNANVLLVQALGPRPEGGEGLSKAYFDALGIAPLPVKGDYLVDIAEYLKTKTKIKRAKHDAIYQQMEEARQAPWSAKDYPILAKWLAANEKPLDIAKEGIARPHYYNPLIVEPGKPMIGALLSTVQKCRSIATMLTTRAMLHLQQGELDAAWDDILACHRLARHLAHGGTLIEGLVGYASDGLAHTAAIRLVQSELAMPKQLSAWLADLQALPSFPPFYETLNRGERIFALDVIQSMMRDPMCLNNDTPKEIELQNVDWPTVFKTFNQRMDNAVKIVTIDPNAKTMLNLKAISKQFNANVKRPKPIAAVLQMFMSPKERGIFLGNVYFGLMVPASERVLEAYIRTLQRDDVEAIAFALAIHKKTTGDYPKQLAELKLTEEPIDRFTGKALLYNRTKQGYTLQSYGADGVPYGSPKQERINFDDDITVTVPIPNK